MVPDEAAHVFIIKTHIITQQDKHDALPTTLIWLPLNILAGFKPTADAM